MLSRMRVLVVEDEPILAEELGNMIMDAEGIVLGPFTSAKDVLALLKQGSAISAAVVEVNLSDGSFTPALEALRARRVPTLVLMGGEIPEDVRRRHPDLVAISKPVRPARLVGELRRATGQLVT